MNILITNDDGIQADGIIALAKAIKEKELRVQAYKEDVRC